MTYLKMKGQEASFWLKMVTRKMKLETEVLSDTVHNVMQPAAGAKKTFHSDETLTESSS